MKHVMWKRWHDPLAPLVGRSSFDELPDDEDEVDDLLYSTGTFEDTGNYKGPCIVGPLGIVPVHETNTPTRLHNFWVGHTRIPVTHGVALTIAEVPGVETLNMYTRYRFRISVGKMFREDEVKAAVANAIGSISGRKERGEVHSIHKMLAKTFPYWGTCKLEDGRFDYAGGETPAEVKAKLAKYESVSGAKLVWSWDEQ